MVTKSRTTKKDLEAKIAELEARIAQLSTQVSGKPSTQAPPPPKQQAPPCCFGGGGACVDGLPDT